MSAPTLPDDDRRADDAGDDAGPVHRRRAWAAAAATIVLGIGAVGGFVATRPAAPLDQRCAAPSAAARWVDEALLAIRRDLPAPTIHARNLLHLSTAMWDAWAAWDPAVPGVVEDVAAPAVEDLDGARSAAVATAAHAVLTARYADAVGGDQSVASMQALRAAGCDSEAALPAAAEVGAAAAAAVLAATADDGAQVDATPDPVNPPLVVSRPGTTMVDPDRWQPLQLDEMVSQNGIPLDATVQSFVGWSWGEVSTFALPADLDPLSFAPGPPRLDGADGGAGYREAALTVLRASAQLDPRDGVEVDASPGSVGGSTLGTDDGDGHDVNPATGEPYAPNPVLRADHERAIAEYWADGPTSETPPGHWNALAREVSDRLAADRLRPFGTGPAVDRLTWDVTLHLALNGALHDAAVAAWGVKAHHDSVRPISMIRHLASLGPASDGATSGGLPLEPGLVEVATARTTAPGGRHEGLADHVGEVVVRTWTPRVPTTGDPAARVHWIPASTWVPYQQPTFVTPAFAGYVSGHSTFSRAAAEVLTAVTDDPWFPGGLGTHLVPAGTLLFEDGPSRDVELQWATYRDAADQAGRSRIAGGIHVVADDLAGRLLGDAVGRAAAERVRDLRDG